MTINFSIGDYVNTNQTFIQNSLVYENFQTLSQTLVSLGYLKGVVSQVAAVGNIAFPSLSFIRVVPTVKSNIAYNLGQGVTLYFSSDTLLNNSFEYSTAFISDTVITRVLNNSGSTISGGSVVRQTGFDTTNQVPTIALASAAATNTSIVLGVLQEDVDNNNLGSVVIQGSLSRDTTAFSAIGDSVYLSDTPGQISTAAGTVAVTIGKILNVSTEGAISVFSSIQGGGGGSAGAIDGTSGMWEVESDGDLVPTTDNDFSLGSISNRASNVHAVNVTTSGIVCSGNMAFIGPRDMTISSNFAIIAEGSVAIQPNQTALYLYAPDHSDGLIITNTDLNMGGTTKPITLTELSSDPAAPATNKAKLYIRDNGSGKTQLVIRFATGAIQVIATEP